MTGPAPRPVLSRLQLGIEKLYRVETRLDVTAFMIDERQRRDAGVSRTPREQLLVQQNEEALSLGLFLDERAIDNLELHDPLDGLDSENFWDFCLAVEGVSHFVYVALCAAADRTVSVLELELQAEVDKFACCSLLPQTDRRALRRRLYDEPQLATDLDADERDRYRTANEQARCYVGMLERDFVAEGRTDEMLRELRRFYRLTLDNKLARIAQLAS